MGSAWTTSQTGYMVWTMFAPSSQQQGNRGFTLVELLTVLAVIAVLVGLLFPVVGSVMNNARKTQASSEEQRIISAVSAYRTDYGKLPINSDQQGGAGSPNYSDTVDGDPHGGYPSAFLFDILRAIPDTLTNNNIGGQLNPRNAVYYQAPNVKNPKQPRSGFILQSPGYTTPGATGNPSYTIIPGSLVDPWGNEYMIFLDANNDGDLNNMFARIYTAYPANQGPAGTVQVVSMGPDSTLGKNNSLTPTGSDDVISW